MRSDFADRAVKTKSTRPWHRGPFVGLLLWFAVVAIVATALQFAVHGLGWRIDVRDETGDGRALLLTLAAAAALMFISSGRRPMQHFGMWIDDNWAPLY